MKQIVKTVRVIVRKNSKQLHEEIRHISPLKELPYDNPSLIDPSKLKIQLTKNLKSLPEFNTNMIFGAVSSDYMLEVDNVNGEWQDPIISEFKNLQIHPFSSSLHYAIQCFEGLKAFKDSKGRVRLFRADLNMNRLRRSCMRISLPDFNPNGLLDCIKQFIVLEQKWIPNQYGYSYYIRPTGISVSEQLGVRAPEKSKIFVVGGPVGPYYPKGFKPIQLYCDHRNIRAAPLGYGQFKLGSNYGPTIKLSKNAEDKGYDQILWLYQDQVMEVGTSNIFIYWKNEQGVEEVVTPKADDLILHGVTRDSVIGLINEMNEVPIVEKNIMIQDIIEAVKSNRLKEIFTCGTAVTIGPVNRFNYKNVDYEVPIDKEIGGGKLSKKLNDKLNQIYYGQLEHPWSVVIN